MHPHFKDGLSLLLLPACPSVEDFAKLLCECRKDRNRFRALRLYECICISGFECDTALGNCLVPLLVKVGYMLDALYVFDRLAIRNELSWNFLLSGYNNCDQPQKTLDLYKMMRNDDASSSAHPNVHTFVALLKACTKLRDMRTSLSVHVECDSRGFLHQDISLATTLIDTYAKCGSMEKARQVFDKLRVRDAISWTSLIVGYVENGKPEEALGCFEKMQSDRVFPDRVTFVSIFKACGSSDSVLEFEAMHCEVERRGFLQGNLELGSSLINLYGKCGSLNKAQEVFDRFTDRDVVLWTSLIAGYVEHSHWKESIQCVEQMRSECIIPDSVVYVLSLNACNSLRAIERGKEVHAVLESDDVLDVEANITTALVDMYMKCGLVRKAQEVFDRVQVHDAATWTALIMGYTENGCGKEALTCFEQMQFEGVSPDAITVVCGLKACGDAVSIDKGEELHRLVEKSGSRTEESIVRSALVDMYAKFGMVSKSQENFDRLVVRDVISWNALIGGYVGGGRCGRVLESFDEMKLNCILPDSLTHMSSLKACGCMGAVEKGRRIHGEILEQGWLTTDAALGASLIDMYGKCGSLQEARGAFDQLPTKDATSWAAVLALYVERGHGEEAMECFERMRSEGMAPDEGTFAHILKACGSVGAIGKGQEIHTDVERAGLLAESCAFLGTSLVDMYAKCGFPSLAWNVFERLQHRDLITWTILMSGYSHVGEAGSVFQLFERMVGEGVKPSSVTFVIVLDACRRAGLSHEGQMYFDAMSREFGIVPVPKHHTAMIDRMCCAGELSEAVMTMATAAMRDDDPSSAAVWHTVLSSCRSIGNMELAERAFERAICVDRSDAAAYVLMSHIYAGS